MTLHHRETLGQYTTLEIVSRAVLETIQNTEKPQNNRALVAALYMRPVGESNAIQATHPPPCADTPLERLKTPLDPGGGRSGIGCKKGGPLPHPHFLLKNISPLLLIHNKE